jgi:hypothetical protein
MTTMQVVVGSQLIMLETMLEPPNQNGVIGNLK